MKSRYIYVIVSVGGAAVLAVEILGTRILGPFYGVSLFLWSALISVTLIALSAGYLIGGRWADRGPHLHRLGQLAAAAGAWLLLVPWIREPVLYLSEPLGLRAAVLVSSLILFFPPLTLLGMISPYAVRLRAQELNEVGRSAGDLYALSTMASVLSALATGFILIPNVGVNRLLFSWGLILLLTGAWGFWSLRKTSVTATALIFLVCASAVVGGIVLSERADPGRGLLMVRQSPYAEIQVVDNGRERMMLIDGAVHSTVVPETFESLFPYVDVLDLGRYVIPEPGNLLLIGLGGGSVAKNYARNGWQVDVVEIDPAVTETAYEFFGLDSSEAQVIHMDGRAALSSLSKTYDMIILDAFGSSSIPFHLITVEVFEAFKKRLTPGGMLAVNLLALGWDDILVQSVGSTLKQIFAHAVVLPTTEPPNALGNIVLFASDKTLELRTQLPPTEYRFSADYNRNHAWDNRFEAPVHGPILTDDLNPVDLWAERINLAERRALDEYFRKEEFFR